MRILIIGGTRFLGRAIVDEALAKGHELTLFNRGRTNPDLYRGVERIQGDRDGGLHALAGRRWDAVVDTCGYVPRVVRASAEFLAGAVDHYTFISSLSVYIDSIPPGTDETGSLATMDDETVEEITGDTYGPLKVLCEQATTSAMDGRAFIIRPGLIVGPHDPSDRFTYWPARVARGGEILAPSSPDYAVQFIDVRDLARWTITGIEQHLTGPYNATGPEQPLALGRLLEAARELSGSDAWFTWVDEEFLLAKDVAPFTEIPLWLPSDAPGFNAFDIRKAQAAGLTFRPFIETIRETLAWAETRGGLYEWRNGLRADREAELLAEWHLHSQSRLAQTFE